MTITDSLANVRGNSEQMFGNEDWALCKRYSLPRKLLCAKTVCTADHHHFLLYFVTAIGATWLWLTTVLAQRM